MKWLLAFCAAFLLLLCRPALGEITVPAKTEVGRQIVATVSVTIPEGATFDGGWAISCSRDTCDATYRALREPKTIGIWAQPGKYTVRYSGFWLLLRDVTFKDGDGNDITITSYLGHGFIDEKATFTVEGDVAPNPPDPPEPQPGGPWQLMLFYDADQLDDYPEAQRQLLTSLVVREKLEAVGHNVLEILEKRAIEAGVSSRYAAYINAVKGDPLPRIAIAPIDGGAVLDFQLPSSFEALEVLLRDPALASYYDLKRRAKR